MGVIEARRRILLSAPHPVTTTPASIATFNTDMVGKLKSAKFGFLPVQSGSGDPSPTNIRPISGWDGIDVTRCGKNIFGGLDFALRLKELNDSITVDETAKTVSFYGSWLQDKMIFDKFDQDKQYTIILRGTGTNANIIGKYATSRLMAITLNSASTSESGSSLSLLTGYAQGGLTTLYYEQCGIFEGAITLDDFASYVGTTYPVTWQSAGTIYGGYVDVVRGEVVAEWASKTLNGTENWVLYDNASEGTSFFTWISGKRGEYQTSISDSFSNVTGAWKSEYKNSTGIYTDYYDNVIFVRPPIAGISTVDAFKTWLSENPVSLVYQLATPIHHTIDPVTLHTLRGVNNIWANTNGTIDLSYWTH